MAQDWLIGFLGQGYFVGFYSTSFVDSLIGLLWHMIQKGYAESDNLIKRRFEQKIY